MTMQATPTRGGGLRFDTIFFAIAALVIVVAVVLLLSGRQQQLRSSPAGLDGLQAWLSSQGQEASSFTGGWPLEEERVGLLVLPIYDTALSDRRSSPTTKEELLLQQDEYDLSAYDLRERAEQVPTLFVLPKWRSGMRLTGLGHPALLTERDRVQSVLEALAGPEVGRLDYIRRPFSDFTYRGRDGQDMTARLYVAQVFEGRGCTPIIGREGAMILAACPLHFSEGEEHMLVLSDPDLLNNHGLRLADNALITLDFMVQNANGNPVVIDYSRFNWLVQQGQAPTRERTWADFLKFFEPPFIFLWIGGALTLLLTLWRSGLRYGPVEAETRAYGASKSDAIRARARLMRLTGQDGALLAEYVQARLTAVAAELFGPAHVRQTEDEAAILRHLARHQPKLAPQFTALLSEIRRMPPHLSAGDAITLVDKFELILEQMANDA